MRDWVNSWYDQNYEIKAKVTTPDQKRRAYARIKSKVKTPPHSNGGEKTQVSSDTEAQLQSEEEERDRPFYLFTGAVVRARRCRRHGSTDKIPESHSGRGVDGQPILFGSSRIRYRTT